MFLKYQPSVYWNIDFWGHGAFFFSQIVYRAVLDEAPFLLFKHQKQCCSLLMQCKKGHLGKETALRVRLPFQSCSHVLKSTTLRKCFFFFCMLLKISLCLFSLMKVIYTETGRATSKQCLCFAQCTLTYFPSGERSGIYVIFTKCYQQCTQLNQT